MFKPYYSTLSYCDVYKKIFNLFSDIHCIYFDISKLPQNLNYHRSWTCVVFLETCFGCCCTRLWHNLPESVRSAGSIALSKNTTESSVSFHCDWHVFLHLSPNLKKKSVWKLSWLDKFCVVIEIYLLENILWTASPLRIARCSPVLCSSLILSRLNGGYIICWSEGSEERNTCSKRWKRIMVECKN